MSGIREDITRIGLDVQMPEGFRYGEEAMENVRLGARLATTAILERLAAHEMGLAEAYRKGAMAALGCEPWEDADDFFSLVGESYAKGEPLPPTMPKPRATEADPSGDRLKLETVLLVAASHCQGGHSDAGHMISEIFAIPFPLDMHNLVRVARGRGFNPAKLWPWLIRTDRGNRPYFTPQEEFDAQASQP